MTAGREFIAVHHRKRLGNWTASWEGGIPARAEKFVHEKEAMSGEVLDWALRGGWRRKGRDRGGNKVV